MVLHRNVVEFRSNVSFSFTDQADGWQAPVAMRRASARPGVSSFGIEEIVDPALEHVGQAERQWQGRVKPCAFDGDDRLAGDAKLVGEALL